MPITQRCDANFIEYGEEGSTAQGACDDGDKCDGNGLCDTNGESSYKPIDFVCREAADECDVE
jgi:hypothetical protein